MRDPGLARIESALEEAMRRGDFDDLPAAGKPLDLPDSHDPNWWINQRLASGEIDREALLPVVVLLRKEYERRAETLVELRSERAAREYAEDFTQRVHQDRRENPFQRMLAPAWDPDAAARQWRELRARTGAQESALESAGEREDAARPTNEAAPRRRWWPFSRRPGHAG